MSQKKYIHIHVICTHIEHDTINTYTAKCTPIINELNQQNTKKYSNNSINAKKKLTLQKKNCKPKKKRFRELRNDYEQCSVFVLVSLEKKQ